MSDNALNAFLHRLGELTEMLVTSNKRYLALAERLDQGLAHVEQRLGAVERRLNDVHAEVARQDNRMLTIEQMLADIQAKLP